MRGLNAGWLLTISLGILAATSHGAEARAACPDLSGAFRYPGIPGLPAICNQNWESRNDMPLPGSGGFHQSAWLPHSLQITQAGCEHLRISTRWGLSNPENFPNDPPDYDLNLDLDLTPAAHRNVTWGTNSLTWRQRYTPASFRWPPWRKEWMELRLTRLPDGSLEYFLRQEGPHGRLIGEVRCVLPPAR